MERLSVLVVDDHRVFSDALAQALRLSSVVADVRTADGVTGAKRLVEERAPDVALVDHGLRDGTGVELCAWLGQHYPDCAAVILSGVVTDTVLQDALAAGCQGVIEKDEPLEHVVRAVERAARGETVLSEGLLTRVVPLLRRRGAPAVDDLTERELEVLRLLADGATNAAIAGSLHLSVHTVRNHVANVLRKLDAHSKLEAAAIGRRRGLIS